MSSVGDNTLLYFFSTYSQSIAALVGLSATFSIFYYQNLQRYLREQSQKISDTFSHRQSSIFTPQEKKTYRDFVNHDQRVIYCEPIFNRWLESDQGKDLLKSSPSGYEEIKAWTFELNEINLTKVRMKSFRRGFLRSTLFGLILIVLGMIGLNSADQIPENGDSRCKILVVATLLASIYLGSLFLVLRQSLQKPMEKL